MPQILRYLLIPVLSFALTACKTEKDERKVVTPAPLLFSELPTTATPIPALPSPAPSVVGQGPNTMDPNNWEIGPIIDGKNSSVGMPLRPSSHPAGWAIELPSSDVTAGHAHYITMRFGSLVGKSRIVMRYRIETEAGVRIIPTKSPNSPAIISLYFQRAGDNWSGVGEFESYRWWASFKAHVNLLPGEYEMSAHLNENWTAIMTSNVSSNPEGFTHALNNADRVGFTLGGGDGLGHGVYASGPARIIITDFRVE